MKSKDLIKSGKFNNLYNMSKTLRFGLKPINETEEHIVNGLIFPSKANGNKIDDKTRAKHYTIVKQMLNEMHRNFIAEALSTENVRKYFSKNKKAVEAIKSCYKNWKENKDISSEQKSLIGDLKKIFGTTAARWKENYEASKIHENNKSSTIKKTASILCDGENTLVLLEWQIETGKIKLAKEEEKGHYYSKDEMLKFLHSFKKFSVYFDGFNENRKNVYSFELISTSIAHRLFERNIKIHFKNIEKWETIQDSLKKGEVEIKKNKTDKEEKKISEILKEKKVDYKKLLKNITLTGKTEEAEINLEKKLEHFFSPEAFLEYLSYDAIENEYNLVIGGLPAQTTREKPRGINEIINTEIRQKAHASRHQFPVLEPLHKQILSKKTAFIDEFNSKEEMFEAIRSFHNNPDNAASEQSASVLTIAKDFRDDMENYLDKELETKEARAAHFLPRKTVETMSIELCGYWNTLNEQWADYLDHQDMRKKEKDQRSNQKAFSFLELEELFKYIQQNQDTGTTSNEDSQHETGFTKEWRKIECAEILKKYINKQLEGIIDTGMEHETSEGEKIKKESIVTAWAELSKSKILENVPDALNKDHVIKVKAYLDSCLRFSGFVRALKVRDKDVSKIQKEQHENWCEIQILNELLKKFPVIDLYNKCRNFITKKDYQESKFKLTFQNPTLAAGWDRNKERDNSCIMLKKDGQYFLGIMSKECNDLFTDKSIEKLEQEKDNYQKMIYRQVANAGKDVQNLIKIGEETERKTGRKNAEGINEILEEIKNKYLPKHINEIRKKESHKTTSEHFKKEDLAEFIEYYKERVIDYFSDFDFHFQPSEEYKSFKNFTDEVSSQGYNIKFKPIPGTYIDESVKEGKLFLFQIYNKDLLAQKTGKSPNLHTLYWKALFDKENLKDVVIKLSGQAELFMREKSIAAPFVHKKEFVLKHKKHASHWEELELPINNPTAWKDVKIKNGITTEKTTIGGHVYEHIMYKGDRIGRIIQNEAQEITKDKRYTENQYFFHVSTILNFKAPDSSFIRNRVNSFLANNRDIKIIGIDRGERHLLYYSVIDQNGKIEEQGTLNVIGEGNNTKDYHALLDQREKERDKARKEWQSIEKIKDLKAGYLSQVVHKITQLIEKYNAIVVLEDLNVGFKRGRQKIEKEIYQRFEKALIDKLNYLVFKDRPARNPGGYLNAAQLTDKFESFEKMGKQNGILFYTVASYTSQTDPVTGFCRSLYPKYKNVKLAQKFWGSFDDIRYNKSEERFEFTFTEGRVEAKNATSDENDTTTGQKKTWTICSNVIRSRYIKRSKDDEATKQNTDAESIGKSGHHETFLVHDELKNLFEKERIDYQNTSSLKDILCQTDNSKFHKELIYYFNAILSMRVTDDQENNNKRDFILSPVEPFFDSRNENRYLPANSDANGAYNIARKGICILRRTPYIEKLKELLEAAEIKRNQMKLSGNAIRTTLASIKDSTIQNEVKALAKKWLQEEKREKRPFDFSGNLFKKSAKNTPLSADEELFLDFFDISISKRRWQDYCQSESVVRKQIELTQ